MSHFVCVHRTIAPVLLQQQLVQHQLPTCSCLFLLYVVSSWKSSYACSRSGIGLPSGKVCPTSKRMRYVGLPADFHAAVNSAIATCGPALM